MKPFSNLTYEEKRAIYSWTSADANQYRYIKGILSGEYNGSLKSVFEQKAYTLLSLFDNYKENISNKVLYRGDVLEDNIYNLSDREIYNKYLDDNPIGKCVILQNTILSFTLSEKIAIKSYSNSEKNKNDTTPTILYVLKKRKSTFLDISMYSQLPHEKEVICNKGIQFKVIDIKEKENNHLIYFLEEC